MTKEQHQVIDLFKALSNEHKVEIIELLAAHTENPMNPNDPYVALTGTYLMNMVGNYQYPEGASNQEAMDHLESYITSWVNGEPWGIK